MPYKPNEGRHKIPKARSCATSGSGSEVALARGGRLTVWLTEEAGAAWHASAMGGRMGSDFFHHRLLAGRARQRSDKPFQPHACIRAGMTTELPSQEGASGLCSGRADHEEVACFSAARAIGIALPAEMQPAGLDPRPLGHLGEAAARFRAPPGGPVDDARPPIRVTP